MKVVKQHQPTKVALEWISAVLEIKSEETEENE